MNETTDTGASARFAHDYAAIADPEERLMAILMDAYDRLPWWKRARLRIRGKLSLLFGRGADRA